MVNAEPSGTVVESSVLSKSIVIVYVPIETPATSGGVPGVVIGVSAPYDVNVRAPSMERIAPPQFEPLAQYWTVAASPRCTKPLISNDTSEPLIATLETRWLRDDPRRRTWNAEVEGIDAASSVSLNVSVTVLLTIVPPTNVSVVACAAPDRSSISSTAIRHSATRSLRATDAVLGYRSASSSRISRSSTMLPV